MAFIRTNKRENPYVQIDKRFTEDSNLTWAAKGLMTYILSRPNNWKINQSDLAKRSACGESVVRNALLNLMEHGYIYYYAERNEKGQINEWIYEVYEMPEFNPYREEAQKKAKEKIAEQKERNRKKAKNRKAKEQKPDAESPDAESPDVESPDVESPSYNNNDLNNNDLNNNDLNNNDLNNNLSIKESIEKLNLPAAIKTVLQKQIDRLIEYKINSSDIELHYNAVKDTYTLGEYTYVLNALFSNMSQSPDNLQSVLNNWLKRNREMMNNVVEKKLANGSMPVREEIVPEWINNQSAAPEANNEEFLERKAKLEAKLKSKYNRKNA